MPVPLPLVSAPSHLQADPSADRLDDRQAELLGQALRLRDLARTGPLPRLLRGKNIGLLGSAEGTHDTTLLLHAAKELGAQVATMRWSLVGAGKLREVRHTGRMLGQLYDVVVCQGLPADLVWQIGQAAGIPVCEDIASDTHPSARLVEMLGEAAQAGDNRRFVLQALLVDALA